MKIQVYMKNVYGNELMYPFCQTAKLFAQLLNVKTFNLEQERNIKALGYEIEIIRAPSVR